MKGAGGAAFMPTRPAVRAGLLAVTVLLHAGLLAVFMASGPVRAPQGTAAAMELVWIRPPSPVVVPPVMVPTPPSRLAKAVRPRRSPLRRPEREPVFNLAPDLDLDLDPDRPPRSAAEAPTASPAPLSAAPVSEPVFDRKAALATARAMANEPDPARAGSAVAQFDRDKKLRATEAEQLGHAIAGAKRGNCLGPNARGSLLTPLMWLLDKKDGGCKF